MMTLIVNGGSSDYNDKQIKIEDDVGDDDDGRKRKRNDILKSRGPGPGMNSAGRLSSLLRLRCVCVEIRWL